ncbi:MAG: Ku protein [Alphaproteobacteria bacterium]|nr:Ku protein [Alphaproteobacteria bacterium]
MPPQTSWRGFLKLSLVSCPVRLFPATTRANRIAFHRLDRKTHNRIEMRPHDAESGEEVPRDQLVKGYEAGAGDFVLIEDDELAALQIESSRTIELETFVDEGEIDTLYLDTPFRLAPDGPVAEETFRVIHAAMKRKGKAALGRVALGSRERLIAVETEAEGLRLTTLRPAEEVRPPDSYFAEIGGGAPSAEMIELAQRIIERKSVHFDPARLEDRYQTALQRLIAAKQAGEEPVQPRQAEAAPVIDLMAALKRSLQEGATSADRPGRSKQRPAAASRKRQEGRARPGGAQHARR